jgi:glucose/arabinose dehydrogenase
MRKILIFTVLIAIISCKNSTQENCYSSSPEKHTILTGLKHPWSICFLSESDVLITEKDGDLLRINLEDTTRAIVQGFPTDLYDSIRIKNRGDNSGIFDVVKHPNFEANQWIYISYAAETDRGRTTKIIRAKLSENQLSALKTILVAEPFTDGLFHYGGGLTFGQDGKLYCTIGERLFREIDQPPLPIAQDVTDKRGKIYRLNDDGTIPNDNPDFGENAVKGLYAIGIRAAQGINMHPKNGSIWFSEHGTFQGDELNKLKAGANYGWPIITSGKYRSDEYIPPKLEDRTFTTPVHYWLQTIAPTGLTFYYGNEFCDWQGDLILSGLSRGSLWRIHIENDEVVSVEELFVNDRVRSRKVAVSPNGKLFMLTDEPDGKLIEIKNGAL